MFVDFENGTLSGNFDGYYAFGAKLKPNGILWDTEHYPDYNEDNDEDGSVALITPTFKNSI